MAKMPASYEIIEMVREEISTEYFQASDAAIARALKVSRTAIADYKSGRSTMSSEVLAQALEILAPGAQQQIERALDEQISRTRDEQQMLYFELVRAAMRVFFAKVKGKVAAFALAMLAAGAGLGIPAASEAYSGPGAGPDIHYTNRRRRRAWDALGGWRARFGRLLGTWFPADPLPV